MLPVDIEDCEGPVDVCDTVELSVWLEDVSVVLNEVAEVGFVAKTVTVTVLG